jgi:hypothetical protein
MRNDYTEVSNIAIVVLEIFDKVENTYMNVWYDHDESPLVL